MGERLWRFQNIGISRLSRRVVLQTLLTTLQCNFTRLQIALRQIRRQHRVLARQGRHRVNVFDDELAVRHPQFHIRQIV
ncbi:hypothetical protein D3C71_2066000 [compost metagenome]